MTRAPFPDFASMYELVCTRGLDALLERIDGSHPAGARLESTLRRSSEILAEAPDQLGAQLLGRLGEGEPPALEQLREEARRWRGRDWLRPRWASLLPPGESPMREERAHHNFVGGLVALPDGRAVTSSEDGSVRIWDIESLRVVGVLRDGSAPVNSLALAPGSSLVAGGDDDGAVLLWDLATGQERSVQGRHEHHVRDVAFAPDGRRLASCSNDGTARIWDVETGEELAVFRGGDDDGDELSTLNEIHFTPDGRHLVVVSIRNAIRIWDLDSGEEREPLFSQANQMVMPVMQGIYFSIPNRSAVGHEYAPAAIRITGDCRHLVSAHKRLIVWDLEGDRRGADAQLVTTEREGWASQDMVLLEDESDGLRALTVGYGTISHWDLESGERLWTLPGHDEEYRSCTLTPDGTHLLVGTKDGRLQSWDLARTPALAKRTGHTRRISTLAVGRDGTRVATAASDGSARLWDTSDGSLVDEQRFDDVFVEVHGTTHDGRAALALAKRDRAILWEMEGGHVRASMHYEDDRGFSHNSIAVTPDDRLAVVGEIGEKLLRWDIERGEVRPFEGESNHVVSLAMAPDGRRAATASFYEGDYQDDPRRPGALRIWDVHEGSLLYEVYPGPGAYFPEILWHPEDADTIVARVSEGGGLWLVDAGDGTRRGVLRSDERPFEGLYGFADGLLVARQTADRDDSDAPRFLALCSLEDAEIHESLALPYPDAPKGRRTLDFTPDLEVVLLTYGRRARLWSPGRDEISGEYVHECPIWSAALTPGGGVVLGDIEGRLHVLDRARAR